MTKDEALKLALKALETPRPFDSYPPLWRAYKKTINEAITAIKEALSEPEQEPMATVTSKLGNSDISMSWWHEPALPVGTKLYTTPQTKVGCVECGVSGGQAFYCSKKAFYCVACAKKLFGGYKESESFDRTASHMANEYVEYKEPILTDAEISESYYEVFKTAMIDIKAFEFAYSLLRKAQKK
jgi:hypothetical protein